VAKLANSAKIREQLEVTLQELTPLKGKRPFKGWIRTLREALGMSGRQLAERIQVEPSRIAEMEKAESHGNITLKSLRRAAEAMGCEVVYAFVPKTSLETSMRQQAEKAAKRKLDSVAHTMRMEDQGLSEKENARQVSKLAEEWAENPPRWLWDAQ
jgi:predicted DNA-binding mobile mystery protein A